MNEQDKLEAAADWSDYRSDFGIPAGVDIALAHHFFIAGWIAGKAGYDKGPMR